MKLVRISLLAMLVISVNAGADAGFVIEGQPLATPVP